MEVSIFWLWLAQDAKTKLIPVMQVGGRSQEMAFAFVHELKGRLAADCVPVFSTDGLKHYFYALTAHFGKWEAGDGKKPVWVLFGKFVYGQVISFASKRSINAGDGPSRWKGAFYGTRRSSIKSV